MSDPEEKLEIKFSFYRDGRVRNSRAPIEADTAFQLSAYFENSIRDFAAQLPKESERAQGLIAITVLQTLQDSRQSILRRCLFSADTDLAKPRFIISASDFNGSRTTFLNDVPRDIKSKIANDFRRNGTALSVLACPWGTDLSEPEFVRAHLRKGASIEPIDGRTLVFNLEKREFFLRETLAL